MAELSNAKCCMPKKRLISAATAGVASGLLTLIDPAEMRPVTRTALCLGTGAAAGALVWIGSGNEEETKEKFKLRAAMALGLSLAGVASTKLGFVIDARIHRGLMSRGVASPRRVMALGSGILTVASFLVEPAYEEPIVSSQQETDTSPVSE